jgi:hypothetical protein
VHAASERLARKHLEKGKAKAATAAAQEAIAGTQGRLARRAAVLAVAGGGQRTVELARKHAVEKADLEALVIQQASALMASWPQLAAVNRLALGGGGGEGGDGNSSDDTGDLRRHKRIGS